jgi:hypothetical protein
MVALTEPAMPIQMITTGSFLSSCPSLGCGVMASGAGAVVDAAVEDSAMLRADSCLRECNWCYWNKRIAEYLSLNASISHHLSFQIFAIEAPPRKQISRFRTFKTTSYHPLHHQPYSSNTSRNMDSQEPNRIVIEQEKDWIRVRQNLKAVVDGLVDEHLNKPGVSENLELRKQVTRRIQKVSDTPWIIKSPRMLIVLVCSQIVEETFSLAVPNLQINGHNYEEYLESAFLTDPAISFSFH